MSTMSSSTSTFKNITLLVLILLAKSSRTGAMARHGPHHVAVKFTTTCPQNIENIVVYSYQDCLTESRGK